MEYVVGLLEKRIADPFIMPKALMPFVSDMKSYSCDSKIRKIYEYIKRNISYSVDYPRQRNSLEVFNEKKGCCIEQAFLYTVIARFSGIDCRIAYVSKDSSNNSVDHACSVTFVDNKPLFVDTTLGGIGVKHKEYKILTDDEVRKDRKRFKERKIHKSDKIAYNLGDVFQYLLDFQFMPYSFDHKDCFYDNLVNLERCFDYFDFKISVESFSQISDKNQIPEVLSPIDNIIIKSFDDSKPYKIGKIVRSMKDFDYTKKSVDLDYLKDAFSCFAETNCDPDKIQRCFADKDRKAIVTCIEDLFLP